MARTVTKPPLVVYPSNSWDGLAAAWIVRRAYQSFRIEPEVVACHTESRLSIDVAGREVIVLGYIFPKATVFHMREAASDLTLHGQDHLSNNNMTGIPFCTIDRSESLVGKAWTTYFADKELPYMLSLIQDRELGHYRYDDTPYLNAYLTSKPLTFATLDEVWDQTQNLVSREILLRKGEVIHNHIEQIVLAAACERRMIHLASHYVPAVNSPVYHQEISERIANEGLFTVVYAIGKDAMCKINLRSAFLDVSEIARSFGGGGYAHAACFNSELSVLFPERNTVSKLLGRLINPLSKT
jgi:hypothetical protein